jgi:hypothetical protein
MSGIGAFLGGMTSKLNNDKDPSAKPAAQSQDEKDEANSKMIQIKNFAGPAKSTAPATPSLPSLSGEQYDNDSNNNGA